MMKERLRPTLAVVCLLLTACLLWSRAAGSAAPTAASLAGVPDGCWVWVDVHRKTLTLYRGTKAERVFTVATGAYATPTPLGVYRVTSRFAGEMSGFGTRFLGINVPWGQYGIHGTNKPNSIGSNASHGCIRMFVKDAEAVYAAVPNGALVVIEGGPYGRLDTYLRTLNAGDRNGHVVVVQERLRALGFYQGSCDGIYGYGTTLAVQKARKAFGLPSVDRVDSALYAALGIILFE